MDALAVLVLALVLPSLASRRWTWRTGALWTVVALLASSLSGYQMVATAIAIAILVLHSRGDLPVRVAAGAVQAAGQLTMYLVARSTTDLDEIEVFIGAVGGHLSVYRNPIRMADHLLEHLGRVVDVYPGGPLWALPWIGVIGLVGLAVLSVRRRGHELWVTGRFLLACFAFAVVMAVFNRFPFGPYSRGWLAEAGSPASRYSLWLVPGMVIGLAVVLEGVRDQASARRRGRQAFDMAAVVVVILVVAVSWNPPKRYVDTSTIEMTQFAERAAGGDGLIITLGVQAYNFAVNTSRAMVLVPTPRSMIGFSPVGADGRVAALGEFATDEYTTSRILELAEGEDRIVVVGALLGKETPQLAGQALAQKGFKVTSTYRKGNDTVTVLDRMM